MNRKESIIIDIQELIINKKKNFTINTVSNLNNEIKSIFKNDF
jgi:hypothetical protein